MKDQAQDDMEFGPLAPMMVDHLQRVSDGWLDIMVRAGDRFERAPTAADDLAFQFCAERIGEADRLLMTISEHNPYWMDRSVTARANEGAVEQWQPAAWMSRTEPASGGLFRGLVFGAAIAALIAIGLAAWGAVPIPF